MSNYTKENLIAIPPSAVPAGTLAMKVGDEIFTPGNIRISSGGSADFYKCASVGRAPGVAPEHSDLSVNGEIVLNMDTAGEVTLQSTWTNGETVCSYDSENKQWQIATDGTVNATAPFDYSNITAGTGTKADPYYWDDSGIATEDRTITSSMLVYNEASGSDDGYRQHIAVNLKANTAYNIGMTTNGSDNKILLLDPNGTQVAEGDDTHMDINGVSCDDALSYTPSADGLYIIAAGRYDVNDVTGSSGSATQVVCYPAPETVQKTPSAFRPWELTWSNNYTVTEVVVPEETVRGEWAGYRAVLTDGVYIFEETVTGNLAYTAITPETGGIYTADATAKIALLDTGFPEDHVYAHALDSNAGWHVSVTPTIAEDDNRRVFQTRGGSNYYVLPTQPENIPLGASPRTMSFWFKSIGDNNFGWCGIGYGTSGGDSRFTWGLRNGNPGVTLWANDNWPGSSTSISDGNWHHVLITYDGNVITQYIDNQKTWDWSAGATNTTWEYIHIGDPWEGYASNGRFADLYIFDRVLNEIEIAHLFVRRTV